MATVDMTDVRPAPDLGGVSEIVEARGSGKVSVLKWLKIENVNVNVDSSNATATFDIVLQRIDGTIMHVFKNIMMATGDSLEAKFLYPDDAVEAGHEA